MRSNSTGSSTAPDSGCAAPGPRPRAGRPSKVCRGGSADAREPGRPSTYIRYPGPAGWATSTRWCQLPALRALLRINWSGCGRVGLDPQVQPVSASAGGRQPQPHRRAVDHSLFSPGLGYPQPEGQGKRPSCGRQGRKSGQGQHAVRAVEAECLPRQPGLVGNLFQLHRKTVILFGALASPRHHPNNARLTPSKQEEAPTTSVTVAKGDSACPSRARKVKESAPVKPDAGR